MVLPQAVAFSTLAGLPPQYGLYGAMLPAIVGALWGSSWHLVSGPTNATSLMVFVTLGALATPFSPTYIELAVTLGLMIGLIKLAFGLARLGSLVNFISTTVVVGFTSGAALLIVAAQLRNFFGLQVPQEASFVPAVVSFVEHGSSISPWITLVGVTTVAAAVAGKRWLPRVPHLMTGMVAGGVVAYAITRLGVAEVPTIGALPSAFPQVSTPSWRLSTWQALAPAAFALTVIGLTEAISSARSVAIKSGQRIDGNQEFIGQGLANIVGAFSSSYPTSGSFNRTGANYDSGAKTPWAAATSAVFLLVILLVVGPLAAYLPLAAMAGILFLVAWSLIDLTAVKRVVAGGRGELLILLVTFVATLTIRLEVAILVGILVSLMVYLHRTTHPRVVRMMSDTATGVRRFSESTNPGALCPQLDIIRVNGSLFFGAVDHIRDQMETIRRERPHATHMLVIGTAINFIDAAGAELFAREAVEARLGGRELYLCNLNPAVRAVLERGAFITAIGRENIFASKTEAISAIYARLDAKTCRDCKVRAFQECQVTLPDGTLRAA